MSAAALPTTSALAPAQPGVTVEQAAQRLVELNTQLEMATEDYNQIQSDIDRTEQSIDGLEEQQEQTSRDLDKARKTLSDTVCQAYRDGTVSYVEVLLGSTTFGDFVTKLDLLDRVAADRADAIQTVRDLKDQLASQHDKLALTLKQQESLKTQAQTKMNTIESSLHASQRLFDSLTPKMQEQVNEKSDTIVSQPAAQSADAAQTQEAQAPDSETAASAPEAASGSSGSSEKGSKPASKPSSSKPSASKGTSSSKEDSSGSAYTPSSPSSSSSTKPSGSSASSGGSTSRHGAHPEVVDIAKQYLGVKYVWGGASPKTGFDCSGLTMYCYGKIGIELSHSSRWQYEEGKHIARSALQPGDLVFFGPNVEGIHHVGIYIGSDEYIHAPQTGDVVKISSLSARSDYVGACRP